MDENNLSRQKLQLLEKECLAIKKLLNIRNWEEEEPHIPSFGKKGTNGGLLICACGVVFIDESVNLSNG